MGIHPKMVKIYFAMKRAKQTYSSNMKPIKVNIREVFAYLFNDMNCLPFCNSLNLEQNEYSIYHIHNYISAQIHYLQYLCLLKQRLC